MFPLKPTTGTTHGCVGSEGKMWATAVDEEEELALVRGGAVGEPPRETGRAG